MNTDAERQPGNGGVVVSCLLFGFCFCFFLGGSWIWCYFPPPISGTFTACFPYMTFHTHQWLGLMLCPLLVLLPMLCSLLVFLCVVFVFKHLFSQHWFCTQAAFIRYFLVIQVCCHQVVKYFCSATRESMKRLQTSNILFSAHQVLSFPALL